MRLEYIKSWGDCWRVKFFNPLDQVNYVHLSKDKFRDELDVWKWWNHNMKEQTNGSNT